MKRSIICFLCFLLLTPAFLAANGGGEAAAPTEISIYWNPDHYYSGYEAQIEEFAAEEGLTTNVQIMNWGSFSTKIKSDFAAGTVPDLIECPANWITEFAVMGQMADLTEQINGWDESADWFEATWDEVSFEDRLYGMKLHHTCFGLFYNKDHFRQAGLDPENPPETLEEFVNAIDTIYKKLGPDVQGYGFDPTSQYLIPFMASGETPSLVKDDKVTINTPAIAEVLTVLQDIAQSGKVFVSDPGDEDARGAFRTLFLNGQISMMISGPWEIGNIKNNFPDLDYGVGMIPHSPDVEARTYVAGTGIAVPKGTQVGADKVFELMKRLTSVEVEVDSTLNYGMLMPRKTWLADPRVANEPAVQLFGAILPQAVPFDLAAKKMALPEITWNGPAFDKLYQKVIYSAEDVQASLDEYEEEANRIIASR